MSPITAIIVAALVTSTPGIVISRRIRAPLLALAGDQGPWAAGVAEAIAAAAPSGSARVLAGQSHAVADALIPVLEEFFS